MAHQNNSAYLSFVESLNEILSEVNITKLNYS
ncbi:hypothetical protein Celly_2937 [Cellulophaga lytica DSM 7489]|uniref:Uncharacterized protein n=1 Tax=Cellulophaga lytica (strain ATCC 23178 / DSM 7489 / JCM 8516 / NBRC 14961 / NCIMB 1423 / VKM B-1433 / Cy l20) TaxID=867900 RepID=F0RC90_CELLC|nr:hypothetical protein Celly_2937 [Cellulophaga lytica DSM 7489]